MAKYIVFVHGLGGVIDETWGRFPEFLNQDESIEHKVLQYGYTSPNIVKQFYQPAPTILNIANGLLTDLKYKCDLNNDDIILVGHSMGGLVIKRLLLRLKAKGINHKIKKICFFDVPHDGAGLANVGKYVAPLNRHMKSLCLNSSDLDDLNDQWVDNELDKVYDIISVIDANETVVSSMSSKSIFRYHEVETINEVNHSTIVKPNSANDTVVLILKRFIKSLRTIDKYSNKSSVSYESWLKHDRKHNSQFVEDDKRIEASSALNITLKSNRKLVRVSGLSGLGKSRLILEYINTCDDLTESNVLIFDGSSNNFEIKMSLKQALEDSAAGLAVIENCSVDLHNYIGRELDSTSAELKVVTIGFDHDPVETSVHIKLEILTTEAIGKIVSQVLPGFSTYDIEKITTFVEGYPLLALLIAERYRDDGVLNSEVTEEAFVNRLISPKENLSSEKLRILKVCSLFDIFRVDGMNQAEVEYIINLSEASRSDFDQLITSFSDRQIINKVGSFARIVPKPLAVYLAVKWWEESLDGTKTILITEMPDSMLHSFCNQIKYLDSSIKVQDFVEGVCSKFSPFGQAGLLLTTKGSKLFRSLVEVNPKATSDVLYRIFELADDSEIELISGDVRRNLVWALEMLCFHKSYFEKSSWCLFKLACFENESYSNNSVGQFSQLFRWQLSGTEANFDQRLIVLNKALQLDEEKADLVIIEAINTAISTHGGTRTVGAEYQGTKPEMKEWSPDTWQEIFDYWQELFNILTRLSEKPYALEAVKKTIGRKIRGLIGPGSIAMLDDIITVIIEKHGKYWPSVSQAIAQVLEYDKGEMHAESLAALMKWKKLLSPDENNLREKLTLVVLDPSRDFQEDESGQLINVAGLEAIEFAKSFISVTDLIPYLGYILEFKEQKQSWVFGRELSLTLSREESKILFSELVKYLLTDRNCKFDFIAGYLSGTYTLHESIWRECVDVFSTNIQLRCYYSEAVRSGKCTVDQLKTLISFIKEDDLDVYSAVLFSHGRALDHLSEEEVSYFCLELCQTSPKATWAAFDILSMYMYGRENYDFNKLKGALEYLLFNVSFHKDCKIKQHDGFHWLKAVDKLLIGNLKFSKQLLNFVVEQVISDDVDYSDLWDVFHPAFYKVFENYADDLWLEFSQEVLLFSASKHRYRIRELFGSAKERRGNSNSIFTLVKEEKIISWCEDEVALLMVAHSLKLFDSSGESRVPNKLLIRIVDKFSHNKKLFDEVRMNFNSRTWVGSIIPGLVEDKELLEPLLQHDSLPVRQWFKDFILMIDKDIEYNSKRETEDKFVRGY